MDLFLISLFRSLNIRTKKKKNITIKQMKFSHQFQATITIYI